MLLLLDYSRGLLHARQHLLLPSPLVFDICFACHSELFVVKKKKKKCCPDIDLNKGNIQRSWITVVFCKRVTVDWYLNICFLSKIWQRLWQKRTRLWSSSSSVQGKRVENAAHGLFPNFSTSFSYLSMSAFNDSCTEHSPRRSLQQGNNGQNAGNAHACLFTCIGKFSKWHVSCC